MLLRPTRNAFSIASTSFSLQASFARVGVVGCCRRQCFSSSPLDRLLSSSHSRSHSHPSRFRFDTAYAFHGKPGSPTYASITSEETHAQAHDPPSPANSSSDPTSDGASSEPRQPQQGFARPDWRDLAASPRLQQGLPDDHPATQWRNKIWQRNPWGAGHDWLFVEPIRADQHQGDVVVGVADGVGGWEESGVDPSVFSQALMWYCRQEVATNQTREPFKVLQSGYDAVLKEKGVIAGSSTACVLSFDAQTGSVNAANLGDSTFLILRRNPSTPPSSPTSPISDETPPPSHSVVHMQASQTHFFNAPRQLAKMPNGANKQGALIDLPTDADLFETGLQDGDIVILATDGFSDNVWPHELEQLVALVQEHQQKPASSAPSPRSTTGSPPRSRVDPRSFAQMLADVCVNFAKICAFKPNKKSPFEAEARRYGHRDLKGGKVDDVCVVVVAVNKES